MAKRKQNNFKMCKSCCFHQMRRFSVWFIEDEKSMASIQLQLNPS